MHSAQPIVIPHATRSPPQNGTHVDMGAHVISEGLAAWASHSIEPFDLPECLDALEFELHSFLGEGPEPFLHLSPHPASRPGTLSLNLETLDPKHPLGASLGYSFAPAKREADLAMRGVKQTPLRV